MAIATTLIPILVPILLAALKAALPNMPKWLIPILAPVVGAASATAAAHGLDDASVSTIDPAVFGAILGSAGVGVREIVDQCKQRLKG